MLSAVAGTSLRGSLRASGIPEVEVDSWLGWIGWLNQAGRRQEARESMAGLLDRVQFYRERLPGVIAQWYADRHGELFGLALEPLRSAAATDVLLVLERLRVAADNRCRLSIMAGLPVAGTLLISHADGHSIAACRDLLLVDGTDFAGATLLVNILVVRYLCGSTERARRLFTSVWQALRPHTIRRDAVPPRIWAT